MIQDRPICFGCEESVDSVADAVFAPPFGDDPGGISGIFHPLCLMRWRERRALIVERMARAREAFFRHLSGQCDCDEA